MSQVENNKKSFLSKTPEYEKEYNKKYYELHKEERLKDAKMIVKCVCGAEVTKSNLNQHEKTKKHVKNIKK